MSEKQKYAYFPGCMIATQEFGIEMALREVLPKLGVELVDIQGFSCCGMPTRHLSLNASLYLGLRNIAVAEKEGLDVLTPCPMCNLSLWEAKNAVDKNPDLLAQMNEKLAMEDLEYSGTADIKHSLEIVHENLDKVTVTKPIGKLVAAHYGCHLIRYDDVKRPDHSESPHKIEDILETLGCETKDYAERLNCCGGPWLANHPDSGLTKTGQKLQAVQAQGFEGLAHMCPWGHKMMDTRQQDAATTVAAKFDVPVFYLSQLVGLAMGIEPEKLGLQLNKSSVGQFFKQEEVPSEDTAGTASSPADNSSDPPSPSSPESDNSDTQEEVSSSEQPTPEGGGSE